ncbi:hypothetical protein NG726_11800 [Pseudomonas sp. MOB-449]|nr:hypothetical protein [Pseudomonas sp. MOB-449]
MSTDRELLELAAKAACIGPVLCYEGARNCLRIGDRKSYRLWRPITDESDALRLAVGLGISVQFQGELAYIGAGSPVMSRELELVMYGIVLAAAEIGRSMP